MTPTETEAIYRKVGKRYTPTTLSKLGAWGWHDLMITAAFRYCCGRDLQDAASALDQAIARIKQENTK